MSEFDKHLLRFMAGILIANLLLNAYLLGGYVHGH